MADDEETKPLTVKTLVLWGTIFTSVMGMIGTATGYYVSLRMDVTIAQHDIDNTNKRLAVVEAKQEALDNRLDDMDKKLTETVTILRRLDNAKVVQAPAQGQ